MRSLNFEEVESLCVEVAEVSLDEVADAQNCKALMAVIQHPEMTGRMAPPASADLIKIVKDLILSLSASGEQRLHFRAALQTLSRLAEMNVTRNCRQPLKLSPLIGVPGISEVMDNHGLGFDQRDVHWDSQSSGATNRIGSQQEQSIHERCQRNVFELLSSPFTMVDVASAGNPARCQEHNTAAPPVGIHSTCSKYQRCEPVDGRHGLYCIVSM